MSPGLIRPPAGQIIRPGVAPWTPGKLPNLAAWYRASDIRGVAHAGAVASWPDLSGNARDITTALAGTSATSPTLQMDQWSRGLTVVRFNGTNDKLGCGFTLNKPVHLFALLKQNSWTSSDYLFDGRTNNTMALQQVTSANRVRQYAGAGTSEADIGTTPCVVSLYYDTSTASEFRLNGAVVASGNVGTANAAGFNLGGIFNVASFAAAFDCHEVLIFSALQAAGVRERIERYLKAKAGLV